MVGVGRHRGTWARWYGGQQLAPDGQKLAGPAATEGLLFFFPSSFCAAPPALVHLSFILTLSTLLRSVQGAPRARHDPDRV